MSTNPEEKEFVEEQEKEEFVKAKTAKEMKAMYRPVFRKTPEKYYPTKVFDKYGYKRAQCPKCDSIFWRRTEARTTCGDSECVGSYTFIGKGFGQGAKGKKITYAQAWQIYRDSLSKEAVPSVPIDRYPVVARWRNDVDYVAAGIFCFQPYCVTGELDPPANPLVQPQFCLRFNDLDNIGVSGRHYSGFIMLGNQVFNKPNDYKYFDEECVEYHLNWLLSMECDLDEVTLIEDVWSGGGNLGSSIELFAHGMEIGNMVFTRFKYFPSGDIEELDVKVIDVGIGLERIPWLINGSATSFEDVFEESLKFLRSRIQIEENKHIWEKFGPYACLLNVDELDDITKAWNFISEKTGLAVEEIRKGMEPLRDLYIICDHTRTIFMAIYDGSLPSNVGGGSNVRNVIRRSFALLKKNQWWDMLGGIDGYIELIDKHRFDLAKVYGEFKPYKSFEEIIKNEYTKWLSTDSESKAKLDKMLKKSKTLTLDDWIIAVTTHGIPADYITELTGQQIPGNFYYALAEKMEKQQKRQPAILYNTAHLAETKNLYYINHKNLKFTSKVQEIFANVTQKNIRNIVILEESAFYPTSGGQLHDTGKITIGEEEYQIVDVEKVGKSVLHILNKPLQNEDNDFYIGKEAQLEIDAERRNILRNHHTATHIIFAACRQVLGPHVWQNGAKKTTESAHLDITHYQSLTKEMEIEIENAANNIILSNHTINKGVIDKAEAEKEHGFRLYQGGIVPGNQLRVVNIEGVDVEACCGTHCDNTSEVGWIKVLKSSRLQDGIVRLYFVAGVKCMKKLNDQASVINDLCKLFNIQQQEVVGKASEFFTRAKKAEKEGDTQQGLILQLRMQNIQATKVPLTFYKAMETDAKVYIVNMKNYIKSMKEIGQGVVFIGNVLPDGNRFVFGQFGTAALFDNQKFLDALKDKNNADPKFKLQLNQLSYKEGKKNVKVQDVNQFLLVGKFNENKVMEYLKSQGFVQGN